MKIWTVCLLSALIGGLTAAAIVRLTEPTQMLAQEQPPRRGPGFPLTPIIPEDSKPQQPPQPKLNPPTAAAENPFGQLSDQNWFESDALTPEEQVNVGVYEAVNRSVVNITTRTIRV